MKILKVEIENYKRIRVFEKVLDGKNLAVSGDTGQGKTTAISALWDIITKVGDPLKHGAKNGKIKVTLGDGNLKVFASRKFTSGTNEVIIMDSEGEPVSVKNFKAWFNTLGVNPHKIMEMGPMEQTKVLLKAVKLPKGVDLAELDTRRETLEMKRSNASTTMRVAKSRVPEEPEQIKPVDVADLMKQLRDVNADNAVIKDRGKIADELTMSINANLNSIEESKRQIEELQERLTQHEQHIKNVETEIASQNGKLEDENEWLKAHPFKATDHIEVQISEADGVNAKVREYDNWKMLSKEAEEAIEKHRKLDEKVKAVDTAKKEAVAEAKWPVKGLSIDNGKVVYKGCLLANCGRSEQMLICGSLAAHTIDKEQIKVVRMDGVESMSKKDFGALEAVFNKKGIQVLSSRVSRGDKEGHEIVIVDGAVAEEKDKAEQKDLFDKKK